VEELSIKVLRFVNFLHKHEIRSSSDKKSTSREGMRHAYALTPCALGDLGDGDSYPLFSKTLRFKLSEILFPGFWGHFTAVKDLISAATQKDSSLIKLKYCFDIFLSRGPE
jgi:hypothetical protein